jgi:guanylate kinase
MEEDGKDYYFLTPDEFKKRIDNDEFAEWQEVYPGAFYGTLKSEIQRIWDQGKAVIFDVDVKGGVNLKKIFGERALAVFVKPPSMEVLEQRLRQRNTETDENISARLFKVKFELGFEKQFDVTLLNNDLDTAFKTAENLVSDFLAKEI